MDRSSSLSVAAIIISVVALGVSLWYGGSRDAGSKPLTKDRIGKVTVKLAYRDAVKAKEYTQRRQQIQASAAPRTSSSPMMDSGDPGEDSCLATLQLVDASSLLAYGEEKVINCKPPYTCLTDGTVFENVVFGDYLLAITHCDGDTYYYHGSGQATSSPVGAEVIKVNEENPDVNITFTIEINP